MWHLDCFCEFRWQRTEIGFVLTIIAKYPSIKNAYCPADGAGAHFQLQASYDTVLKSSSFPQLAVAGQCMDISTRCRSHVNSGDDRLLDDCFANFSTKE